jgi:replicative DNA helicase
LVTNRGVRIVFIDYVQLMKIGEKSSDETSELRIITRDLKALALQLNIPIVILSQLKRDIDARTNKRPMLSDLKMSGSLEEDADTIMFPYRDSYYKKDVKFAPKEQGRVELDIAKGRNIGTRNLDSYIDFETFSFISMNDYGI